MLAWPRLSSALSEPDTDAPPQPPEPERPSLLSSEDAKDFTDSSAIFETSARGSLWKLVAVKSRTFCRSKRTSRELCGPSGTMGAEFGS